MEEKRSENGLDSGLEESPAAQVQAQLQDVVDRCLDKVKANAISCNSVTNNSGVGTPLELGIAARRCAE